jgi:hypothetical protein
MAAEHLPTGLTIVIDFAAALSIVVLVACEWEVFDSIVSSHGISPTVITIGVIDMFPFAFGLIWLLYRCSTILSRYPFVLRLHLPENILTVVILLPAFLLYLRAR